MTTSQRSALIRQVIDEAIGLGVLEPLLADESVTEIMVNGPGDVWIERDGRIEPANVRFTSESQLYQTIDRSSLRSTGGSTSRARWSTPVSRPASG